MDLAASDPAAGESPELSALESAPAEGMARATGVIALGNVASRVLGLVREMLLSALFGPSAAVDAFNFAVIVPRSLYDLLIGGHVNSALVPVLSEYAAKEDRADLWDLVSRLLGIVVVALSLLVLGLEVLAPQVIGVVTNADATPEVVAQATDLLRVTAPALMFLSLFAVLSGLLYALRRFTWPAFASTVFNGTIVVATILLYRMIGISAAAVGWLVGALVQLALQAPGLRDARLRITIRGALSHPGVRRIGLLYVPVMASLALDVLVNRTFSYNLASGTGEKAVSYMSWATTLIQFPQGLVAIAISAAILPTLSRQAAHHSRAELGPFKITLGQGLGLATVLIIPAAIGLFALAEPVVALLFERGKFVAEDTSITSLALRLYLIGLPFAAIDLLLVYAFYAQQDTLTPAIVGLITLAAYMAVALGLVRWYSFYALMVADSVKHLLHTAISAYLLRRKVGGFGNQRLLRTAGLALVAATVMGVLTYGAALITGALLPGGLIGDLGVVTVAGLVGVISFSGLATWLGLEEWRWIRDLFRSRLPF